MPEGVSIGVVGFDGQASQLLAPTDDTEAVARAIDRLELGEGTAIGEAVDTSLDTISDTLEQDSSRPRRPPAEDDEAPATVVLLSDGETTRAARTTAAAQAAKQGVPVHTIAFGTDRGSVTAPDGQKVPVPVNRAALRAWPTRPTGSTSRRPPPTSSSRSSSSSAARPRPAT